MVKAWTGGETRAWFNLKGAMAEAESLAETLEPGAWVEIRREDSHGKLCANNARMQYPAWEFIARADGDEVVLLGRVRA